MKRSTIFTTLFVLVFIIGAVQVHASWGVFVKDPVLDQLRMEMIKSVGVDTVVTQSFQAAENRLYILDQRITTLLDNTAKSCAEKVSATASLAEAKTLVVSATKSDLLLVPDSLPQATDSLLDTKAVTDAKTSLDQALVLMKEIVAKVGSCSQYADVQVAIPTKSN